MDLDGSTVVRSESVTDLAAELTHGSTGRIRSSLPGVSKFSNLVGSASSYSLSSHASEPVTTGEPTPVPILPVTTPKPFGLGTLNISNFKVEFDATSLSSSTLLSFSFIQCSLRSIFWSWCILYLCWRVFDYMAG